MAHITNASIVDPGNPTGGDWVEATHASVNTDATGAGIQLFKDSISTFTAVENANVTLPIGDFDFEIPNGDMPDSETLHMMQVWLADRVSDLSMNADNDDFTDDNGTVYVLLHSDDPGTGIADELSGNGYTRTAVTIGTSGGTAAVLQLALGSAP